MTVQGVAAMDFFGGVAIAFVAVLALLWSSSPKQRNK